MNGYILKSISEQIYVLFVSVFDIETLFMCLLNSLLENGVFNKFQNYRVRQDKMGKHADSYANCSITQKPIKIELSQKFV